MPTSRPRPTSCAGPPADTLRVRLYVGEQFRWARLRNGNLGDALLTRAGFREKLYRQQPLRPQEWVRFQENVLHEAENQGYPFATIGLDSLQLTGTDIAGRVVLRRGPAIVFDSIQIVGKTKTKARFLTKYLQIEPGQPFSQQRLRDADRRLRQLPYLQVKAEPEVRFSQGRARVYFLLDDRTANQFDAIVGVLPNPNPGLGQKKVQITGDVTLNLRNIGGGGKGLGVQWRKLDATSQLLDAQYLHPTFFGTPLEVSASFNLLKQSDLFLTTRPRLQVAYPTARAGPAGRVLRAAQLPPAQPGLGPAAAPPPCPKTSTRSSAPTASTTPGTPSTTPISRAAGCC